MNDWAMLLFPFHDTRRKSTTLLNCRPISDIIATYVRVRASAPAASGRCRMRCRNGGLRGQRQIATSDEERPANDQRARPSTYRAPPTIERGLFGRAADAL